jgi:hypothetical protein
MNKKIFFIILGALLLLALIFILWFWFFGRDRSDVLPNTGSFGSAGNASQNTGNSGTGGNDQTPIGSNTSVPTGGTSGSSGGSSNQGISSSGLTTSFITTPSGVTWLDGTGGGSVNNRFTPTPINALNTIDVSGIGLIGNNNTGTGGQGGGIGLGGAAAGAAAGLAACTAGIFLGGAGGAAVGATAAGAAAASLVPGFIVADPGLRAQTAVSLGFQSNDTIRENFLNCITRGIARIAIEQITTSVVDWINSGFDGQPSFVQDYEQFFTDVADKAAGQYIEGSGLAFLCSPFQLQVKIAIAQSYANRKSSSASSCTLTNVVGNVEEFLNGNFAAGGWGGFLSLTTMPINNPYGAYIHGQISLGNEIASAQASAQANIKDGFIGSKEEYDCQVRVNSQGVAERRCKERIVTPGTILENALIDTNNQTLLSLNLADNFDEIIGALVQQLMTRTLYDGLANLSNKGSYKDNFSQAKTQAALDAAQSLLTSLQSASQLSQQYGTSQQGSIADIQVAQAQLNTLYNCWATAALQPGLTSAQVAQAESNAGQASTTIRSLETRVALFNNNIVKANAAVTTIQHLQTSALMATTLAEVQAVQARFTAAQNSGALITQATVTSAQQDRQTLQSEMNGINQNTSTQLTQCYAFGQ